MRRLFSPLIVESDAFLDMPLSTQALYFHLGMNADDDGFVNPKKIMRLIGATDDELRILVAKRFVLCFESGVIVIKHWLIHNSIRKDRYNETQYLEEKKTLFIKANKAYTDDGNQMATTRHTQVKLSKVNIPASKDAGGLPIKKKKTMKKNSFNYNENNTSDSYEDVIDLESNERAVPKSNTSSKVRELVDWAVNRRGRKFISYPKQYKAINQLKNSDQNITPDDIKVRWVEMEQDPFWKEKGFDFMSVMSSFERKPLK